MREKKQTAKHTFREAVVVLVGGQESVELVGQVLGKGLPSYNKNMINIKTETKTLSLFMFDANKMKPESETKKLSLRQKNLSLRQVFSSLRQETCL